MRVRDTTVAYGPGRGQLPIPNYLVINDVDMFNVINENKSNKTNSSDVVFCI